MYVVYANRLLHCLERIGLVSFRPRQTSPMSEKGEFGNIALPCHLLGSGTVDIRDGRDGTRGGGATVAVRLGFRGGCFRPTAVG